MFRKKFIFGLKTVALSLLAGFLLFVTTGFLGLLLYIVLDPRMPADDLASFGLFFLPSIVLGLPSLVITGGFAIQGRLPALPLVLLGVSVVFAILGFAGFWVGAMGI